MIQRTTEAENWATSWAELSGDSLCVAIWAAVSATVFVQRLAQLCSEQRSAQLCGVQLSVQLCRVWGCQCSCVECSCQHSCVRCGCQWRCVGCGCQCSCVGCGCGCGYQRSCVGCSCKCSCVGCGCQCSCVGVGWGCQCSCVGCGSLLFSLFSLPQSSDISVSHSKSTRVMDVLLLLHYLSSLSARCCGEWRQGAYAPYPWWVPDLEWQLFI